MRRCITSVVLALAACGGGREVQIEVAIPGPDSVDAPVAHLQLVALPYDRDSVLRALEAGRSRPADASRKLDSLYAAFRVPYGAYAGAAYQVQKHERALGYLRLQLDSLPRSSPLYDSLYRRFADGSDTIALIRKRRDNALNELGAARATLGQPIDSLRQLMGRWEDSTYRGYDSITKRLGSGLGRVPVMDSTDASGKAVLRLPSGNWWIYARSWDAWDPHSEWYWNVPVTRDHLVLDKSTGQRLPRY